MQKHCYKYYWSRLRQKPSVWWHTVLHSCTISTTTSTRKVMSSKSGGVNKVCTLLLLHFSIQSTYCGTFSLTMGKKPSEWKRRGVLCGTVLFLKFFNSSWASWSISIHSAYLSSSSRSYRVKERASDLLRLFFQLWKSSEVWICRLFCD